MVCECFWLLFKSSFIDVALIFRVCSGEDFALTLPLLLLLLLLSAWELLLSVSTTVASFLLDSVLFFEIFNWVVFLGDGDFDFLVSFLVPFVVNCLEDIDELEEDRVSVFREGEGDLDLLLVDLTALPVMTRSELLTVLMPLNPYTGVFLDTVFRVVGAWYTRPTGMVGQITTSWRTVTLLQSYYADIYWTH